MSQLDITELDTAVFTAEMIDQQLDGLETQAIDERRLYRLGNPVVREAALTAYDQQLTAFCADIGEMVLNLPYEELETEYKELSNVALKLAAESQATTQSAQELSEALATLLPFAATDISTKTEEVIQGLATARNGHLPEQEQLRLDKLEIINGVLNRPIKGRAADRLLEYALEHTDNKGEAKLDTLQTKTCINASLLIRQLTELEPRKRLMEFSKAFIGYPVEVTELGEAIYHYDETRNVDERRHIIAIILNPKQTSGRATTRQLGEEGLVLQHGWIQNKEGTANKRRIVRSLRASEYQVDAHAVSYNLEEDEYSWEPVTDIQLKSVEAR